MNYPSSLLQFDYLTHLTLHAEQQDTALITIETQNLCPNLIALDLVNTYLTYFDSAIQELQLLSEARIMPTYMRQLTHLHFEGNNAHSRIRKPSHSIPSINAGSLTSTHELINYASFEFKCSPIEHLVDIIYFMLTHYPYLANDKCFDRKLSHLNTDLTGF